MFSTYYLLDFCDDALSSGPASHRNITEGFVSACAFLVGSAVQSNTLFEFCFDSCTFL